MLSLAVEARLISIDSWHRKPRLPDSREGGGIQAWHPVLRDGCCYTWTGI